MSKKTFDLISCITTCVCGLAIGIVTFINPAYAEAINASIAIVEGAVISICGKFVK